MDDQFAEIFSDPRGQPKDITEDEDYAKFVESMVVHCRCNPAWLRPCDGVLAGGICDDMGNGDTDIDEDDETEYDDGHEHP